MGESTSERRKKQQEILDSYPLLAKKGLTSESTFKQIAGAFELDEVSANRALLQALGQLTKAVPRKYDPNEEVVMINIRVPRWLRKEFQDLAESRKQTFQSVVREALDMYLDSESN